MCVCVCVSVCACVCGACGDTQGGGGHHNREEALQGSMGCLLGACVCVTPKYFNQINSIHYKHHHSTALSALQQCLDNPLRVAFPPSQHNTKTMYSAPCAYRNQQPCMPMR